MAEVAHQDRATATELLGAFAPGPEGAALSEAELLAMAPGVVLEVLRVDPHVVLPPPMARAFGELAQALGISEGVSLAELETKFGAHYAKHAKLASHLAELRRRIRAALASGGPEAARAAVGGLLGQQAQAFQSREGPAPKGAIKAQPWARFSLQANNLKEKK